MPTLTGVLTPEGAMVEVLVGLSASSVQALRAALRPVPSPSSVRAILDTGAEATCIDAGVIQGLGLALAGTTLANLPAHGGLTAAALYDASLTIVHPSGNVRENLNIRDLTVFELSLLPLGYQGIVGRDVLARCRFVYDGQKNRFRLSY